MEFFSVYSAFFFCLVEIPSMFFNFSFLSRANIDFLIIIILHFLHFSGLYRLIHLSFLTIPAFDLDGGDFLQTIQIYFSFCESTIPTSVHFLTVATCYLI